MELRTCTLCQIALYSFKKICLSPLCLLLSLLRGQHFSAEICFQYLFKIHRSKFCVLQSLFKFRKRKTYGIFIKCLSKYPTDGSPLFFGSIFQCNDPCYFSVSFPFLFKFRKASPVRRISSKIFRTCFIIVHLKSSHVRSTYTGSPIPPGSSPDDEVPQSEGL